MSVAIWEISEGVRREVMMSPPSRSRMEIISSIEAVEGSLTIEVVGVKEGSMGDGGMKPPILDVGFGAWNLKESLKCRSKEGRIK